MNLFEDSNTHCAFYNQKEHVFLIQSESYRMDNWSLR